MGERPAPVIRVELRTVQEKTRPSETPKFTENGVSYFEKMPLPPNEKPRTTLLRIDDPGVREWVVKFINDSNDQKGLYWKSTPGSMKNPLYGAFEHVIVVDYDNEGNITNFRNDGIVHKDGPINQITGRPTPGAVFLPIEQRPDDSYWVHFRWQFRPNILDGRIPTSMTDSQNIQKWEEANRGKYIATCPGGFANSVGETPEAVASREALEEGGIRINEYNYTSKNFNRAFETTPVDVGFGSFTKIPGAELSNDAEQFLQGNYAVPFGIFKSEDAMVEAAYLHAARELGFINTSLRRNR